MNETDRGIWDNSEFSLFYTPLRNIWSLWTPNTNNRIGLRFCRLPTLYYCACHPKTIPGRCVRVSSVPNERTTTVSTKVQLGSRTIIQISTGPQWKFLPRPEPSVVVVVDPGRSFVGPGSRGVRCTDPGWGRLLRYQDDFHVPVECDSLW